jgi:hypothetical protein
VGVDQLVLFSILASWQIKRTAVVNKRAASSVGVNEFDAGGHMDSMQGGKLSNPKAENSTLLRNVGTGF